MYVGRYLDSQTMTLRHRNHQCHVSEHQTVSKERSDRNEDRSNDGVEDTAWVLARRNRGPGSTGDLVRSKMSIFCFGRRLISTDRQETKPPPLTATSHLLRFGFFDGHGSISILVYSEKMNAKNACASSLGKKGRKTISGKSSRYYAKC